MSDDAAIVRALGRLLDRQHAAPQYFEREASVRAWLGARHVSPEIIDRVIRLNPRLVEGEKLRGFHYTGNSDPQIHYDCMAKGAFIRRYGRAAWERVAARGVIKRGHRKYVTHVAAMEANH